ncbi:MAG: protease modulator HflC [bacterium]|nr:protease modulator HflC [bacterium]
MISKLPKILLLIIIGGIVLSSAYIVRETEQVVITQFGKPIGNAINTPGIHFKIPLIQKTHFFDKRFLEWDGYPNQVPTKDKRFINVDTFARWRISDPLLFYRRVRDERGAQSRLDDILDGETRNAVAKHNLVELIRSQNREAVVNEDNDENISVLDKIIFGRRKITEAIVKEASLKTQELGIEILSLQFKRINYVREVEEKIFERMIAERTRIADKYRSEGEGEASRIIGEKERKLAEIISKAYKEAQIIKGKADARAANIYARAYNQTAISREFYTFLRTMESYSKIFKEEDLMLMATDGDLFKYLKNK